jgi:hypothetical protein
MENHEKIKIEVKETFLELDRHAKAANEKLRMFLKDLSNEDMIARINHLNLSDKSLNFLCGGIALEAEDYEICAAVETIKKERAEKWLQVKEQITDLSLSTPPTPADILPFT